MTCSSCSHENPDKAKFCLECGTALALRCDACGTELPTGAKFCMECGAPVSGRAAASRPVEAAGTRKIVSILFADLVGSTGLHERLDPESARRFMESYYAVARRAVQGHGGTVTQFLGDGVKAVFGVPRVAEDDAIRAVRAGAAMQEQFRALADQQRLAVGDTGLRVAVNTGEVIAKGETEIIGDPVNVAARLQELGRDGDVVIGEATQRLVAPRVSLELLGSFDLKGRAGAVKAYRVLSLEASRRAVAAAFVGREEELTRIARVHDRAVETSSSHLAVVVGSPGLGKSRLIEEFARRCSGTATIVAARCDAAGGATFAPVADALRELLEIDAGVPVDAMRAAVAEVVRGDDAERITAGIVGLLGGTPGAPEETFFVVRRFLAGLAERLPVVLVIDDLQWAEPLLLDLVEHLVQWGRDLPLLVLIGARPELREVRSSLAAPGGLVAEVLTLDGLDATAAMRLAAGVVGAEDLPAAVAAKVLATSEGNPLFIGELVRMLVDEGAITREGGRWIPGEALATVEMPPTIHALLASRIERLEPLERAVLEHAAVVGRHFSRSAVAGLLRHDGADLDACIESLRRAELIERDTGWLLGEPVLRFHHVLTRDAAYRRLLKGTRAELHERHADWIEERVGEAPEHDEMIGRHLEEAHRLLGELGPIDEAGRILGERAARRLAAAGRRALEGDDVPLAAGLLGRAFDRLGADDPGRADLLLDWCEALLAAGDPTRGAEAIAELGRLVDDSARLRAWHTCFVGQHTVLTAPKELSSTVEGVAAAAKSLASLDDAAGEAKGHYVHALALARLGKVGACETSLDQALAAARRAGDRRQANTVLALAPLAALWGPSPVTRASGRCLDVVRVLRITQGAPAVEAIALSCQGVLEALRGRTEAAHRMLASGRAMAEELGITQRLLEADAFAGFLALLEGDAPSAERRLRGAYQGLRELGLGIDAARAAALLGRSCLAQGRIDEAEALSRESEALAGDDLKAAIAWRGVRAEALARRAEHGPAIELAQAAVEIAAATDALLDHADARLALAASLRAAGRAAEAGTEDRRAIELWEAKGATLLAERARRVAAPAASPVVASVPRVAPAPRRRPVRPNFAIENRRWLDAAVSARDAQALAGLYRPDVEIVDHPFGMEYGRDVVVDRNRSFIEESADGAFHHQALATLGDFVALCRLQASASASIVRGVALGAAEVTYLVVIEADEQGCARRIDLFGEDALGAAVVRLYERHAAFCPEGPERERAATAARVVRMALTPFDLDPPESLVDPGIELVDHRNLGSWNARGARAAMEHLAALHDVADDAVVRNEDILALEPDGLLIRRLHSGTERAGGGTYEREYHILGALGPDGRLGRVEFFDLGDEARALARFDELTTGAAAGHSTRRPSRRAVRPNASSELMLEIEAGFAARDLNAIAARLSERLHTIEHPTGVTYGREGQVETIERMLRLPNLDFRIDVLATLGEALGLGRRCVTASGTARGRFDVGEYQMDHIVLTGADANGRLELSEVFFADHLGDAILRLYECHASSLPGGARRSRADRVAQTVRALLTPFDFEAVAPVLDPTIEIVDHRTLGTWSAQGAPAALEQIRGLRDVSLDAVVKDEDLLALEPDALLVRRMHSGAERVGGGVYERQFLVLAAFGVDGRLSRWEFFDVVDEPHALARFGELTAESPGRLATKPPSRRPVRANAATRLGEGFGRAVAARDAAGLESLLAGDLRVEHRPTGASLSGREFMGIWRRAFAAGHLESGLETIASLGESLGIHRYRVSVEGVHDAVMAGFGRWELEGVVVVEADAFGKCHRMDLFAPEKLGRAIVRLYESRAESLPEGPERTRAAGIARALAGFDGPIDPDRIAPAYDPASRNVDHRVFGTWTTNDAAELLGHYRHQLDLAPDFAARFEDVLALGAETLLARMSFFGTGRDSGGAFENRLLVLFTFDADGRLRDTETFEPEQEKAALARYQELVDRVDGEPGPQPFASAATRAVDRDTAALAGADGSPTFAAPPSGGPARRVWNRADALGERIVDTWRACDWPAMQALLDDGFRFADRRPLILLELDRDGWIDMTRRFADMDSARLAAETIATRGDRLVLRRVRIEVEEGDVGPSLVEHLNLWATNERGDRLIEGVRFDVADIETAYAELDARYEAEQGDRLPASWALLRRWTRAVAERDWETVASLCADDFVERDHRNLSLLGLTRGVEPWIEALRTVSDLAPDAVFRIRHFIPGARGYYEEGGFYGTREGGPFEVVLNALVEIDDRDLLSRVDLYDDDRVFAASRWSGLGLPVPWAVPQSADLDAPGPVVAEPNAAHAAMRQWLATYDHAAATGDWDPMRDVCAPHLAFEDRRRLFRLSGGVDLMMASARERLAIGARPRLELLGTAGDRIAIDRVLWSGGPADGPFEIEYLGLWEVDEAGRVVAMLLFDADERPAVRREAWARWAAIEPELDEILAVVSGLTEAFNAHDRQRVRALCADDLVYHDRRRTGVGRIDGAEAAIASIEEYWKLAGDQKLDLGWHWPAYGRHGGLTFVRRFGTLPDGGAFESEYLEIFGVRDGHATHLELFEIEDLDRALARFEELGPPNPARKSPTAAALRIPPNTAVRRLESWKEALRTGDADATRALLDPSFVVEDRRRLIRTTTGPQAEAANVRFFIERGWRPTTTLLATAGDRLVLQRWLWTCGDGNARSEIELLELDELGDSGRFARSVVFDPEDRAAASQELLERYVATGADGWPHHGFEALRGWNEHDLARVRRGLTDDFVLEDHRLAGMGHLEGPDAYVESVAALQELIPDARSDFLCHVATGEHGRVSVMRTWGVNTEGGEVESFFVLWTRYRDGKASRFEMFEITDLDEVVVRFEATRGTASGS